MLGAVPDGADDLADWVARIAERRFPGGLSDEFTASFAAEQFVRWWMTFRPAEERPALTALAEHIKPEPPF